MDSSITEIRLPFPDILMELNDGDPIEQAAGDFGNCSLQQLVRRSNMSFVVRARQKSSGLPVAIKFCHPDIVSTHGERFRREVRLTREIHCAGVVKILEADMVGTSNGSPWYVMEWVEGPTLGQYFSDPATSLAERVAAIEQLAHVVSMLHEKGTMHRDLKPSNCIWRDGRVVLLDLGLAYSKDGHDISNTGNVVQGTAGYAPLWHLRDRRLILDSVDGEAYRKKWDVYSLGVMLMESLTGVSPKIDNNPDFTPDGAVALLRKHLAEDERLDAFVRRCLSPDPDDCPADADEVYQALRAWLAGGAPGPESAAAQSVHPGTLSLHVEPPGATVYLMSADAVGVLVVPEVVAPDSGDVVFERPDADASYVLMVSKTGYEHYEHRVKPTEGSLRVRLESLLCKVEFRTAPGTLLELTNAVGETHRFGPVGAKGIMLVDTLTEGDWSYQLTLDDHESVSGTLDDLEHGRPRKIEQMLAPMPGRIKLLGHRQIEVWNEVERLGSTHSWIPLAAGEHHLRFERPDFGGAALNATIPPAQDVVLSVPRLQEGASLADLSLARPAKGFENKLGMKFEPVAGTDVLFCIWPTRVKDYQTYAEAKSGVDGTWKKPGFKQKPDHPVVNVNWEDAQAFCRWLTETDRASGLVRPDQEYRLAQDWEWSVAVGLDEEREESPQSKDCQVSDVYPWGTQWPPPKGAGNYDSSLKVDKFVFTSPVGSFKPNRHGLYDLGGNVWEWCEDFYDGNGGARVLRGGSWCNRAQVNLLSSDRNPYAVPDYHDDDCGFRVVLSGEASR